MATFSSKEEIHRQQLKNHFLKRVIIRFDYTSIVDMQNVLNQIVSFLSPPKQYFRSLNQMQIGARSLDIKGTQETNKMDYDRPKVYRFSDCVLEPVQNVTLDFDRNYLCMEIHCDSNYTVVDSYLEMMATLINIILGCEGFVQLTRIGIRKIDGVDAIKPADADNVFEYFSQQLPWDRKDLMQMRQYTDYMTSPEIEAYVIYNRIVRVVENGTNLRFTLDIDCYKDSDFLNPRPEYDLIQKWLIEMNDKLFNLFKMGIKLDYFNKNI